MRERKDEMKSDSFLWMSLQVRGLKRWTPKRIPLERRNTDERTGSLTGWEGKYSPML